LRNDLLPRDPAVVEILQGAMQGKVEEHYAKVFAWYELRENVRQFFETYGLLRPSRRRVPGRGS